MRERFIDFLKNERTMDVNGIPVITNVLFIDMDFSNIDLTRVQFVNCNFLSCSFCGSFMNHVVFSSCNLGNSTFDEHNIKSFKTMAFPTKYDCIITLKEFLDTYEDNMLRIKKIKNNPLYFCSFFSPSESFSLKEPIEDFVIGYKDDEEHLSNEARSDTTSPDLSIPSYERDPYEP